MSKELSPIERASSILRFDETKAELAELAKSSQSITGITNPDGYQECHRARMVLKNARVDIQKRGKEARDDANAFAKAVIGKEKELIAVIEPEESRLQELQTAWDEAREAERQAKIKAEQERVEELQRMVADIRGYSAEAVGKTSAQIAELAAELECVEPGDLYQEFRDQAVQAREETLAKLRELGAAAAEREAEQERIRQEQEAERARIEAEREELARLRAEAEERDRKAAAERAEADRVAAEKREAEAAAERDRLAAERAEQEKAAAAERERIAEERAELERQQAEQRRQQLERERAERQREIDAATLVDAATEAHALLVDIGQGDHLTTHKLGAALARETESRKAA